MSKQPLSIEQIANLAADVREIKNFAENHGFNSGLVQAKVSPEAATARKPWDWPLICLAGSTVLLIVLLSVMTFKENIPPKVANFLLVVGLLFILGAAISAHRKFDNSMITVMVGLGLIIVLLIGAGVFTPREAAAIFQDIGKK